MGSSAQRSSPVPRHSIYDAFGGDKNRPGTETHLAVQVQVVRVSLPVATHHASRLVAMRAVGKGALRGCVRRCLRLAPVTLLLLAGALHTWVKKVRARVRPKVRAGLAPNAQGWRFSKMNKGPHVRGCSGHRTKPKAVGRSAQSTLRKGLPGRTKDRTSEAVAGTRRQIRRLEGAVLKVSSC